MEASLAGNLEQMNTSSAKNVIMPTAIFKRIFLLSVAPHLRHFFLFALFFAPHFLQTRICTGFFSMITASFLYSVALLYHKNGIKANDIEVIDFSSKRVYHENKKLEG